MAVEKHTTYRKNALAIGLSLVFAVQLSACGSGGGSEVSGSSTGSGGSSNNSVSTPAPPQPDSIDLKPALPTNAQKQYVVQGDDGTEKRAWITDGSEAGTKKLSSDAQFKPRTLDIKQQTNDGGHVIFPTQDNYWAITDGSESGTKFITLDNRKVKVAHTPAAYDMSYNRLIAPSTPVLFNGSYHLMSEDGHLLKFRGDGEAISLATVSSDAPAEQNCGIHQMMTPSQDGSTQVPFDGPRQFGKHIVFADNLFITVGFRHYYIQNGFADQRQHTNLYRYDPSISAPCKMVEVAFKDADGTDITSQVNKDHLNHTQVWFKELNGKYYAHFITRYVKYRRLELLQGHLYEYDSQQHAFKRIAINVTVNGQSENVNRYENAMNWVQLSDNTLVGLYDNQHDINDSKRYLVRFDGNTASVSNIEDSSGQISTDDITTSRRHGRYAIMVHNDKIILREGNDRAGGLYRGTHLIKVDPADGNATRIPYAAGGNLSSSPSISTFRLQAKLSNGASILHVRRGNRMKEIWYLNDNEVGLTKDIAAPAPIYSSNPPNRFGRVPTVLGTNDDNSKAIFAAKSTSDGKELWFTLGTGNTSDTDVIKHINPGTGDGVLYEDVVRL